MFDGVDITWNRVQGGAAVAPMLSRAAPQFDAAHPEKTVAAAGGAPVIAAMKGILPRKKLVELDEPWRLCARTSTSNARPIAVTRPGDAVERDGHAIVRSPVAVEVKRVNWTRNPGSQPGEIPAAVLENNQPWTQDGHVAVRADQPTRSRTGSRPREGDVYGIARPAD